MIKFAKIRENAIIPTKRREDAGYDVYPCLDGEDIIIKPNETIKIPLGIGGVFGDELVAILKERSSNGSKGLLQGAGVIDSGYRGEWLSPITNTTDKKVIITDDVDFWDNKVLYPNLIVLSSRKAISQAVFLVLAEHESEEITYEELMNTKSERLDGKLGSTNK